ncbi:hypothetical protein FQN60_007101 [Etheostoma spectabile]|uniref:Uncharacterized protein n=1 Tax=Etheostoma spectabile TaxID=54343 RepID=A0A5J5CG65_9PERO|nr:hypothetical protein FQN60_007101 [Etheostoma spectabile]
MIHKPKIIPHKLDVPYEELGLDHLRGQIPKPSLSEGIRGTNNGCGTAAALSYPGEGRMPSSERPPDSSTSLKRCRQCPSCPNHGSKGLLGLQVQPSPIIPLVLHNIMEHLSKRADPPEQSPVCYPCTWSRSASTEPNAAGPSGTPQRAGCPPGCPWPNNFSGGESHGVEEFLPASCRSYYSYPRKRSPGTPKTCTSSLGRL